MKLTWQVANETVEEKQKRLKETGQTQEDQIIDLLTKFRAVGVNEISFTGGEFFAMNNADKVLKACKDKSFKTSVTTSADFMTPAKFDLVKNDLSQITFRLDSVNNYKQSNGKEPYLTRLVKMVEHINQVEPGYPIEVNSIICKENLCYLLGMARELELLHINKWNLFELSNVSVSQNENRKKTTISSDDFKSAVEFLRERSSLKIEDFPKDKIETKFVVSPHEELRYSVGGKEKLLLQNLGRQPYVVIFNEINKLSSNFDKLKNCTIKKDKIKPIEILY